MKSEQISDAMNLISDNVIEETDAVRHSETGHEEKNPEEKKNEKKKHINIRWQWAGAAACLAVIAYAGIRLLPPPETRDNLIPPEHSSQPDTPLPPEHSSQPVELPDLPMLTVWDESRVPIAGGDGGTWLYDISEYVNANPWREDAGLTTLPVFSNPLAYFIDPKTHDPIVTGADPDKMRELLLDVAGRFGLDTDTLTILDDAPDEAARQRLLKRFNGTIPDGYLDPTRLMIKTDSLEIKVDQTLTAEITIDPSIPLPDAYNFKFHASYEDLSAVAEYLKTEYKDVLQFDSPLINVYGGGYDINFEQSYHIEFFDAGASDVERIVNYNFNRIAFYGGSEGKLWLARIFRPDLSGKVGDYPIITLDEAKELLSNGKYVTSTRREMPGMEYVKKAELVYMPNTIYSYDSNQYIMPYYCFYVEMPDQKYKDALNTYASYYVPAVRGEYISDMPAWDAALSIGA